MRLLVPVADATNLDPPPTSGRPDLTLIFTKHTGLLPMDPKQETVDSQDILQEEIADLERRLAAAKARLSTPPKGSDTTQPSLQCKCLTHQPAQATENLTPKSTAQLTNTLPPPPLRLPTAHWFIRIQQRARIIPRAQPPRHILLVPSALTLLLRRHNAALCPRRPPRPLLSHRTGRPARRSGHLHRRPESQRLAGPGPPVHMGALV